MIRTLAGELISYLEMAALPTAPRLAREQTRVALRAWRLWPETLETAELLVSELVTNAVKTATPKPGHLRYADLACAECIAMTLRHAPGRLTIEVTDNNSSPPVLIEADVTAESGRGLMTVQALSKEWGHYFPPSGGKVVYSVIGA
jgi:anti-sigma regulatory factor (Ser/Thr protein kinase)